MKPRCFSRTGAAFLAALILAGTAAAQSSGDDPLSGGLDLTPKLDDSSLFATTSSSENSSSLPSIADIRQNGSGNSAQVTQSSSLYGAFAIIAQVGSDNIVNVDQCGCGSFVDIIQNGDGNLSEVSQTGRGNVLVHRQNGDGLALSIAQYGGSQIAITQTGP